MRLVGYDRAPARLPRSSGAPAPSPAGASPIARASSCAALGLPRSSAGASCRAAGWRRWARRSREGVVVKNPISADYEVMRTSLLPGAARRRPAQRRARRRRTSALFEVGPVVRRGADAKEPPAEPTLRGRDPGRPARRLAEARRAAVDFFDAKRVAVELLRGLGRRGAALRARARGGAAAPGRRRRDSRRRRRRAHRPGRRGPPARSRARWAWTSARVYVEVAARRRRGRAAAGPQRAAAALPGGHARHLVLDRRRRSPPTSSARC